MKITVSAVFYHLEIYIRGYVFNRNIYVLVRVYHFSCSITDFVITELLLVEMIVNGDVTVWKIHQ